MNGQQHYAGASVELDRLLLRRRQVDESRAAIVWGTANAILASIMCIEMFFGELVLSWYFQRRYLYYFAGCLTVALIVNTLKHLVTYVRPYLYTSTIQLSATKHKLFRISQQDPMVTIATSVAIVTPTSKAGPQYSPSNYTTPPLHSDLPRTSFNQRGSPYQSNLPRDSQPHVDPQWLEPLAQYLGVVPDPVRTFSYTSLQSASNTSLDGSPEYSADQSYAATDLGASFNSSRASRGSPRYTATSENGVRARMVSLKSSPVLRLDECISDMDTLGQFFDQQDIKDNKTSPVGINMSPASEAGCIWNYGRSFTDPQSLRKYQYQLACRNAQSPTCSDILRTEMSSTAGAEIWSKLDISPGQLDDWLENLRKWLRQTILVRVMDELNDINKALVHLSSSDIQIGHVTLATLRQISVSKAQQLPKLETLVPYLDITQNQEYLIQRLRTLSSGGCMSDFTWNAGGEFKGMNWEENLPTDSAIVMHLLCTYMDSRLPPHPGHPDGKTFTSQHFIKPPDKPNLIDKKDNLCIYQTSINPPHYNVVIDNQVWAVPKGRNNLFFAILVFLYLVKTKEHGMLRRVNLGMSGINILWVLES